MNMIRAVEQFTTQEENPHLTEMTILRKTMSLWKPRSLLSKFWGQKSSVVVLHVSVSSVTGEPVCWTDKLKIRTNK